MQVTTRSHNFRQRVGPCAARRGNTDVVRRRAAGVQGATAIRRKVTRRKTALLKRAEVTNPTADFVTKTYPHCMPPEHTQIAPRVDAGPECATAAERRNRAINGEAFGDATDIKAYASGKLAQAIAS